MRVLVGAILFILTIGFFQNCAPLHESGSQTLGSGLGQGGSAASSLANFEKTLLPIITQNCGGCHGVSQQPLFAVSDSQKGHDTLINSRLVDLSSPGGSRVVQKIQNGHQGLSNMVASDIEVAITAWAADL